MQLVLDMPMASDSSVGTARRCRVIGQIISDLGRAAPQSGLGIAMQHIAGDANDMLDQGLPLGRGNGAGRAEYLGGPGFMPIAPFGDRRVAAGGTPRSAESFDLLQQGGLVFLQLDDGVGLRLRGGFEGFFGSAGHRA